MSLSLDVRPELQERVIEEAHRLNLDPSALLSEMINAGLIIMDFEGAGRDVADPDVAALITRSYQDPLTSLANRRTFYMQLERQWQESAKTGTALTLLLLDIDDFKRINDREGHARGDELLQEIATVLVHHTRAQDYVARLGGDNFVILLPGKDAAGAVSLIETIHTVMREFFSDKSQPVAVSIGLAEAPPFSGHAYDFLRRADEAMYKEKLGKQKGHSETSAFEITQKWEEQSASQKERVQRNTQLIALLHSFEEGDPDQQHQDLEALQAGLEEARPGQRRLFSEGVNP